MTSGASVWYVGSYCEILLLLNVADMDYLLCGNCGVSSVEYGVHLVGVNRLSACREFFGVHI